MTCKAIRNPRCRSLVTFISGKRKQQGMTQSGQGRRMLLSRQTVQKVESCEVRLDLVRYVTLCRILGLNAGQLLGRLEYPSDEDDPLYLTEIALVLSGARVREVLEFRPPQIFVRHLTERPVNIGESRRFESCRRSHCRARIC